MLGVQLGGLGAVVRGVEMMGVRHMAVVPRLLVVAGFVRRDRMVVVFRGVLVVLGGLPVMLDLLFVRHDYDSFLGFLTAGPGVG